MRESRPPAGAKEPRKRTKKPRPSDADRPTLQAVPNEPAPTPIRTGAGQKSSSRPAPPSNRPKRELPPYLRIVK